MAEEQLTCMARIWPSWASQRLTCGSPVRGRRCLRYGHPDHERNCTPESCVFGHAHCPVVRKAEQDDPEDGHTFRIEVHSRGSYAVWDSEKGQAGPHSDADWMGEPPLTLEVRAWSLKVALQKALEHPLPDWSREGHRLGDPPEEAG